MSLFQNFTGTMQTDFLIGGPSGIMLRKVSGGFEIRDSGGTALATLKTANLDVTGDIVISGNVDGVEVSTLKSNFDTHNNSVANPHSVTKTQVSLGNVDNTSDANKPVSTDQQTALDLKANDNIVIKKDGSVTFSGDQPMGGFKLTGLGVCTLDSDAANKSYVDGVASGLDVKASVRLATDGVLPSCTASGTGVGKTLTASADGTLSIDGTATALNDRILVKNQSAGEDNGIYEVTTLGESGVPFVLTRATDADQDAEVTAGLFTFVSEGSVNSDRGFVLTTNDPITVDTTSLTFSQFSGAGQITDGAGLTKTGDTLSVNVDASTIVIVGDTLEVPAGGITVTELATDAVSTAKILDLNVTNAKLATDAVSTAKILDLNVTNAKLATGINADKISNGDVTNAEFDYLKNVTSDIQAQLNAAAPSTGTSKFIKIAVTSTDVSSTTSIPTNAVIKNVYTKIKTVYSGGTGATIQVTVDGTTPLEIQATTENHPHALNVYKSEPISDVAAINAGVVKVVIGGNPTNGAADVIVEYVEAFLS